MITANQVRRKALSVLRAPVTLKRSGRGQNSACALAPFARYARSRVTSLLCIVPLLSSCHKLRALAGDPSAQQTTPPPTRIQGYDQDGQEVNITPGPPSTPATRSQGWHVTPLKCSADEKLLGMCGGSPLPSGHSSTYVPNYSTPQPAPYHFHYSTRSRSHY